jgi:sporulation protein YunB
MYRRGRMRIKRSRGLKLSNFQVFLISILIFAIVTFMGLGYVSDKLKPTLMDMAQNEAEQAVMYAINYGLSNATLEEMQNDVDLNKQDVIESNRGFFITTYDDEGKIEEISFDTAAIRNYLYKKTIRIQTFMRLVENGKISIEHGTDRIIRINQKPVGTSASVPLGQVTDTSLFGNLGPDVLIHFDPISDVETYVEQKLTEKGINNVQIQLLIHVKVHIRVVLPFATKPTVIQEEVPIAEHLYTGDIPKYINGKPAQETLK